MPCSAARPHSLGPLLGCPSAPCTALGDGGHPAESAYCSVLGFKTKFRLSSAQTFLNVGKDFSVLKHKPKASAKFSFLGFDVSGKTKDSRDADSNASTWGRQQGVPRAPHSSKGVVSAPEPPSALYSQVHLLGAPASWCRPQTHQNHRWPLVCSDQRLLLNSAPRGWSPHSPLIHPGSWGHPFSFLKIYLFI